MIDCIHSSTNSKVLLFSFMTPQTALAPRQWNMFSCPSHPTDGKSSSQRGWNGVAEILKWHLWSRGSGLLVSFIPQAYSRTQTEASERQRHFRDWAFQFVSGPVLRLQYGHFQGTISEARLYCSILFWKCNMIIHFYIIVIILDSITWGSYNKFFFFIIDIFWIYYEYPCIYIIYMCVFKQFITPGWI